jgi:3-oxoacyl-[acyl-carrier-protein] synthase III
MVVTTKEGVGDASGGGYLIEGADTTNVPSSVFAMKLGNDNELRRHYFEMDGEAVYRFAVHRAFPEAIAMFDSVALKEPFYIAPHQPSRRTLSGIIEHNCLAPESVYTDGIRHGNTTGASPLRALQDVRDRGLDAQYNKTMLLGFGIDNLVAAALLKKI